MRSDEWIAWTLLIAGGYAGGSLLFCRWIPLWLRGVDICARSDDGNPGAANVFTLCDWKLGLLCLCLDMAKGFLPVFAAQKWLDILAWPVTLVMAAPALGHAFSCFYHLHGGKCIAVSFGEVLALLWTTPVGLFLAGYYILFSTLWRIEDTRRRSLTAFSCFLPSALALEIALRQYAIAAGCAVLCGVALLKHLESPDAQAKRAD